MSEQYQIPSYHEVKETEEEKEQRERLKQKFADLSSKQPDVLDETAKSIVERVATFLAVLLALTVLGNNFPPPYLVSHPWEKYLAMGILICYLLALGMAM